MSHEITIRQSGKAEMAYVGDTPWHGLGQELRKGAAIAEWEHAAGMDFAINRSRVRYGEGENQQIFDKHHVLFRSDSKAPLGIVSPTFKIVQPREVLGFFKDLVEDSDFTLETAGTLFGGRRFWALAHIGESAIITNKADIVGGYLLLCTGADGTLATTARFTTVRVVCNNTLSMAMSAKAKNEYVVSHRSHFDGAVAKAHLGLAHGNFSTFIKEMRNLSKQRITPADASLLTSKLILETDPRRPSLATLAGDGQARVEALLAAQKATGYTDIMRLFEGAGRGADMEGVAGTAWGWVNAVTEFVDHSSRTKSVDNRLDSAWFGRGDAMKTTAVELATSL